MAGDVDPDAVVRDRRGACSATGPAAGRGVAAPIDDTSAVAERFVRVVHRPGAVQTEIRIGHPRPPAPPPRLPRGLGHEHDPGRAVQLAAHDATCARRRATRTAPYAGFDLRRGRGPFSARAAVNTEVTVPALHEFLTELERIREAPVTDAELQAARDYLVGVFPLRFETPGPVAGSLAGLFVHDLPDDELARYRPAIEAVTADDVLRVAREHIHPERCAIVLVGDHDKFGADLEAAGDRAGGRGGATTAEATPGR